MTESFDGYEPAPLEVREIVAPELTDLVGNRRAYFTVRLSRALDDWEQEALRQEQFDDMVRVDTSPDALQFHEWCADEGKLAELIRRTVEDLRQRAARLRDQANARHRRLEDAARQAQFDLHSGPASGQTPNRLSDEEIAGPFFADS
jgi:hypothetical protein